jgi:hypothetical protein
VACQFWGSMVSFSQISMSAFCGGRERVYQAVAFVTPSRVILDGRPGLSPVSKAIWPLIESYVQLRR